MGDNCGWFTSTKPIEPLSVLVNVCMKFWPIVIVLFLSEWTRWSPQQFIYWVFYCFNIFMSSWNRSFDFSNTKFFVRESASSSNEFLLSILQTTSTPFFFNYFRKNVAWRPPKTAVKEKISLSSQFKFR